MSPFLSPAQVFNAPEAPSFLGTGDFDGDSHLDAVATAVESQALYLFPGDGRGNLGQAVPIELAGKVTAIVTGEINRVDGLADLAVGVVGPNGPEVMIFEGPEGALRSEPETLALPAQATALALGQLDENYSADFVVAAGHNLLIVHGRDRELSMAQIRQAEASQAVISQRSFPFALTSVALGDFAQGDRMDVALLSEDRVIYLLENRGEDLPGPSALEHCR